MPASEACGHRSHSVHGIKYLICFNQAVLYTGQPSVNNCKEITTNVRLVSKTRMRPYKVLGLGEDLGTSSIWKAPESEVVPGLWTSCLRCQCYLRTKVEAVPLAAWISMLFLHEKESTGAPSSPLEEQGKRKAGIKSAQEVEHQLPSHPPSHSRGVAWYHRYK